MTRGLRLVDISMELGGRAIVQDMNLQVAEGELVCLLGPSGCGKTTTLRIIGGFLTADRGTVEISGKNFTYASPEKRPTAMVFQNYALWPHMTVAANIAFGLTLRKMPKRAVREKVDWALDLVNLTRHRDSRPARISGGEQQRVALARALVLEPEVLLMDEPLSNLDAKLRVRVRDDIRQIQQRLGITTVLVTHDQDEAMAIADRIAVMNGGRIEQDATPGELYARPHTTFVAEFVGAMNFIDAAPTSRGVALPGGPVVPVEHFSGPTGDRVGIRPEDLIVERSTTDDAVGTIVRTVPHGHFLEMLIDCGGTTLRSYGRTGLPIGERVRLRARTALVYAGGTLNRSEPLNTSPAPDRDRQDAFR